MRSIVSMSGVCATLRSLFEKFGKSGAVAQFGLEAFFHLGTFRMLALGNTIEQVRLRVISGEVELALRRQIEGDQRPFDRELVSGVRLTVSGH